MTRFVVDLGDIDLSEEMRMSISLDLQKTALSHVAKLKFDEPIALKFPKEWLGLIAHRNLDALLDGEAVLQKNLFSARGMR